MDLDTELRRVSNLTIHVDSANCISVVVNGVSFRFGSLALAVLDTFHGPLTIAEGITRLRIRVPGSEAQRELLDTILSLIRVGVLVDCAIVQHRFNDRPFPYGGYDTPFVHISILQDRARKSQFLAGLRETIRPGDTVLDLGTGCGIMALAAIQAGAEHVYAVEPSAMAEAAKAVFDANGVADRVTVLRGWGSQIVLPSRADVLVTDIVGNEPFDMQIVEALTDARDRLLKPDARMLPRSFRLNLRLTEAEPEFARRYSFRPDDFARWKDWYGVDLSALGSIGRDTETPTYIKPDEARLWPMFSEAAVVIGIDLASPFKEIAGSACLTATRDCEVNAILGHFEAVLGPTVRYRADPEGSSRDSHWYSPVWLLATPLLLSKGETVVVDYAYLGQGRSRLGLGTPIEALSV